MPNSIRKFGQRFVRELMTTLELSQLEEQEKMKKNSITAEKLDRIFDEGEEDVLQYFDLSKATKPRLEPKRVSVDFPVWMVEELDQAARELGVTRQSVIKVYISEKLKEKTG